MTTDNDPELDRKRLGEISSGFVKVCDTLKEASYQLRVRKISSYPLFIISPEKASIGLPLIEKGKLNSDFFVNFSYLEQFLETGLVDPAKRDDFISTYKDADEYCCLFVVLPDFVNFIFLPYPEE